MNSKKKNKNRQHKPPNPTPPQTQKVSEPSSPPEVTNAEIESVVEERVPNIVSENVAAEVKETEETPKKPKRNRGKKKKEDDKSDNDHETRIEEVIPGTGLQPMKESSNEANIAPTVRKKKNKNKKSQGQGEYIEETEIVKSAEVDESSHQSQEVAEMKIEEPEQETKSTKKKNKKKKNRNDSERSDKAEEVSCTSAFQKLLADDVKAKTSLQPSTDDSSVSEATVKEVEVTPQPENIDGQEPVQKDENNKNKKKNKKDKKQPTLPDVPKTAEQPQSFEIKAAENISIPSNVIDAASELVLKETDEIKNESMPSTSTVDEKNLKYKAKIAKPVEKKKKGKGNEKHCDENLEKESLGSKIVNVEEPVTDTNTEFKQEPSATGGEVQITEDLDDVILVPITEITPDWQEEVKIEEGNGPVIGCDDKNDTVAQPIGNFAKPRNRKKSPKPSRKSDMPMSSDISTQISKSEEPMLEASSSSNEQTELKPSINVEEHPQIKFAEKTELPKDVMELAHDTTITKNRDIKQKSPKPSKDKESTAVIPIETSVEIHKSGDIMPEFEFNKEQDFKSKVNLQEKVISLEDKYEDIQVASNNTRKNRKKSPKPPKKNEIDSVISSEIEKSEINLTDETTLPAATSCPEISTLKIEKISEIKETFSVDKTEQQKDDIERMKTPDSEKCQKRKKSPKPVLDIDVASSSRDTQESKQNIIKIEDIIIIQAEVVSDEKAQKCDTFIAGEDGTDKQDPVQKTETAHDSGKSKKRKKSPKPPQRDSNSEKTSALETQGEIQIPMTPETQDTKLPPENIAIELETLKMEPVPLPSDVTPDFIEYPRCSSEHLDNNNNMIIQEISRSDAKLEVPFIIPETPLIQSANINSPELDHVIKAIEPEPINKSIEEKTDLKSKVMEVNQEMEELRLSIERSLAELTSLEKTDMEEKVEEHTVDKIEMKPELPIAEKQSEIVTAGNVEDSTQPMAEIKPCQDPICPARKDHKGKGKSKKKGKQEAATQNPLTQSSSHATTDSEKSTQTQDTKKDTNNKSEQKSSDTQGQEKQKADETKGNKDEDLTVNNNNEKTGQPEFAPIENFEDAMTSSVDDVNKTFEMIVNDINPRLSASLNNPEINVIAPQEDKKDSKQDKQNPISPPKNLLGHPDIPVQSSRPDYKKEKNKIPNNRQAKVKIKDMNQVQIDTPEKSKQSKESQTESKREHLSYKRPDESICVTNQNDDYVYKYSFRKVFLQCACHVCKKDLKQTKVPCSYCNLIFYCNQKHKDEDYTQHQALCFAVSTIVHLKDQKFIYADARDVTGHNYRLLRMQMIVSCEKVLKRRLAPWEQEALLYPRMCGYSSCREWRQGKLVDCEGCGQISYCSDNPDHLPKGHARWCKSYNLYRALVKHQQTQGRLEPKLPTKVVDLSPLPDNINEVLASMYEEKIDMSDIEYAALTQLATAPLTALFCLQHRPNTANGITKKSTLTLHIVGAELQFEADVLNKWEVFLLHLVPHVKELKVVLVGPDLNPSNLPLELLGKIKLCENCRQNKRRVVFGFQDKRTYHEFWASEDFTTPDLVCAFNPSIQRSSTYNGKDTWPSTINCVLKLKTPLAITSYTLSELTSDLLRLQECAGVGYNVVFAPKNNSFSSVRPDRNFISDDEAPLLFKNHCVTVVCGV